MNGLKRKLHDGALAETDRLQSSSRKDPDLSIGQAAAARPFFLAVHCGAGYHAKPKDAAYRAVMAHACQVGCDRLAENPEHGAMDAVCAAIAVLEDCPLLNAGFGSNLTDSGIVECDASVMDGTSGGFGAVGAAAGLRHPISVARRLMHEDTHAAALPFGLVRPLLLVGEGATKWAREHNEELNEQDGNVSAEALATWRKWKQIVDEEGAWSGDGGVHVQPQSRKDTVGAICVDSNGCVASGASSGGPILKRDGRVGAAACIGCGCWATKAQGEMPAAAATCSGTGEAIMRCMLASRVAEALACHAERPAGVLCAEFIDKHFVTGGGESEGGVLAVRQICDDVVTKVELVCGHSTPSMGFGWLSSRMEGPKTKISRVEPTQRYSTISMFV